MMRPKTIKTAIVDDEPIARKNLSALLRDDAEIEIVGECGNGRDTLALLEKTSVDLLFLDIQMPGMSGFDVLERIDPGAIPAIVFVTAFDQYALKAFEVHALDYLLKPFNDDRFAAALARAKSRVADRAASELNRELTALLAERRDGVPATDEQSVPRRFLIKSASRVFFVGADEIDWIEAFDYYVKLHVGPKTHLLRETMNDLETKLDPDAFQRIHRSAIVNLRRVAEVVVFPGGDYGVVLRDGTRLKMSRRRRDHVETLLKKMKGFPPDPVQNG